MGEMKRAIGAGLPETVGNHEISSASGEVVVTHDNGTIIPDTKALKSKNSGKFGENWKVRKERLLLWAKWRQAARPLTFPEWL